MRSNLKYIRLLTSIFLIFFISVLHLKAQDDSENDIYAKFNPSFLVTLSSNYYLPDEAVKISLGGRWYKVDSTFTFTVYKVRDPEQFLLKQSDNYYLGINGTDTSSLLNLCDTVDVFERNVNSTRYPLKKIKGEYAYWLGDNIYYYPRSKGIYIIKTSFRKKCTYNGFIVTELGLIVHPSDNSILTYTVNRYTGEPINNVSLSYFIKSVKIDSVLTENSIYNKVYSETERELKYRKGVNTPLIIARKGDDVTVTNFNYYFYNNTSRFIAYIYTNQPVYRPLSKVGFFGVIRENRSWGYGNVIQKDVVLTVKDSKNAELLKKVVKTDSNGCFQDSIELDESVPVGNYSIIAELESASKYNKEEDNVNLETFTANFFVEEFKKPEFKVDIKTPKDQYNNGEQISVNVQADYYFGSPVQDASYEFNIYKKPLYKPWWYFSPYRWWYEDYYSNIEPNSLYSNSSYIFNSNGELDKEGKAVINYTINEDFKYLYESYWYKGQYYETDFTYVIQVVVKDKSRRNISETKTVNVTRSDYFISSNTDRYLVKPGEKIGVQVNALDFADKPINCKYSVTANRITYEGKYPKQKKITNFVTTLNGDTQADGQGVTFLDAADEGYYSIEIVSFDSKGRKITSTTGCFVSSGRMDWWYFDPGTVQIIPDKESYKPGDTCRALVVCAHDTANVLVVSSNKNLISYKLERIENGSQYVDIPVEAISTPNFYIAVSYINNGVIYTNSKSVIVIPENKFLNVEVSSDKPIYKPRVETEITVKVTDILNNPVRNARLTLSMVDESIYAVRPDNTKNIRNAFYSAQRWFSSPYFNIHAYSYSKQSEYTGLMTRFDYKKIPVEDLCTIRGRIINRRGYAVEKGYLMLDKFWLAAVTAKDGSFEFKIPEGKFSFGIIFNDYDIDGEFDLEIQKGKNTYLEIKINDESIISAWLDDKETGEIEVRGGKFDKIGIYLSDTLTIATDTLTIEADRKGIDFEQSGRLVTEQQIDNQGIRGIQNISAKTSGVVTDLIELPVKEEFVDAETRTDFRDAVYWSADVLTDENGTAKVKVKLPDNLTTWRITARAITNNTEVGQSTGSLICRKDLLIRVAAPRFFQQNDEVIISTIVHNYLSEEKTAKLKFSADNLSVDTSSGKEMFIKLGKNEEKRIDWKVKVNNPIGIAKIFASALTNEESDAMELKVPVQPYGLKITQHLAFDFSKNNKTVIKKFDLPDDIDLRTANLNIKVSPSIASSLVSSLNSLVNYPYGCMEQTTSRFVPAVIVANVLKQFNAPENEFLKYRLPRVIKKGFSKINAYQHKDGGWGWWSNDNSEPFMSSYVMYGLIMAKSSGYEVNNEIYSKGINYLISLLNNPKSKIDSTTIAFMLYTLSLEDTAKQDLIRNKIRTLEDAKVNDFGKALLALASYKMNLKETAEDYIDELIRNVNYTDDGAYWGGKIYRYSWQYDYIQTTSLVLKALLADETIRNKNKELIARTVDWLMLQRKGNSWGSTQQNAFIVYALADYVKYTNELEPDYSIKIDVNNETAAERKITKEDVYGGDIEYQISVYKLKRGENIIKIEKNGSGKVYFSSDLAYYSGSNKIKSDNEGFDVEREYFRLEKHYDPEIKSFIYNKKPVKETVKSGDVILVKIRVTPEEKYSKYFVMEDPIPAGCEIVKEEWAYKIVDEDDYNKNDYNIWRWWYTEREFRDNRVSFFASSMYAGTYEFSYLMRAEIPGKFNIMPTQAMLMYYPELNGNGENQKLRIED